MFCCCRVFFVRGSNKGRCEFLLIHNLSCLFLDDCGHFFICFSSYETGQSTGCRTRVITMSVVHILKRGSFLNHSLTSWHFDQGSTQPPTHLKTSALRSEGHQINLPPVDLTHRNKPQIQTAASLVLIQVNPSSS